MKSSIYYHIPFVEGIRVHRNWAQDLDNPDFPEPGPYNREIGGHAICFVGYEDDPNREG